MSNAHPEGCAPECSCGKIDNFSHSIPHAPAATHRLGADRHYCRNPRCRVRLATPIDNPRRAFCCRGCHEAFFARRCIVCEAALRAGPANRRTCRRSKCRAAYRRYRESYQWSRSDERPSRKPQNTGAETRLKSWGPELSPTELRLATLPLDPAIAAHLRRADRALWQARSLTAGGVVNLIGGYRWPGARLDPQLLATVINCQTGRGCDGFSPEN
jgi:hypothetical protein